MCLYIGSVNVGVSGDFDRIEFGIKRVLGCLPSTAGHISVLQLSDMELRLFKHLSDEVIFRQISLEDKQQHKLFSHTICRFVYPHIASCGRLINKPNYFAFITLPPKHGNYSGENYLMSSLECIKLFYHQGCCMCHVFYSSSSSQVADILTSISDGFNRTHFAV